MTCIETPDGIIIARRSTNGEGSFAKDRWSEFSVMLRPQSPRWKVEVVGKSIREGETDRVSSFSADNLPEALGWLDNSAPARILRNEAMAWADANPDLCASRPIDLPFTGTTVEEALEWLYGAAALEQRGINTRIGEDFGTGESSVRMARARGADLRVSLVEVCRYLDRGALNKARELRAAMKEAAAHA